MSEEFISARVLEIRHISPVVRTFKLAYPLAGNFLPGQFVMLSLPIEHEFNTRSYSIASAPNSENWIELCIVRKPDGAGTTFLFDTIKEGDTISVSQPLGKFILEDGSSPLCFISTGTGIAPFRSMIQYDIARYGKLTREIYLVFGNRKTEDILYLEEWRLLEREEELFHFIPVLSRADEEWDGAKGYVHSQYLPLAGEFPDMSFYLCGWTEMVREAKNNLKALGFSRKQLKFELYD